MKEARAGMWEGIRTRLETLSPPIDADATELGPILEEIETRLSDYIAPGGTGRATRLFVSQLTREHLRKTISFFLSMGPNESAVPFQRSGTGTLNTLVLALLTFIADIKKDNVIFAMEEPEIALPPHTQRRIANYLLKETSQCFVTSHSPYVIEHFEPDGIIKLKRDLQGKLTGQSVALPVTMKAKSYRYNFRRALAEAMLSRGVIIGEGVTEQDLLLATAHKLESSDHTLFPFDVAGVCVVNADGDGNLEKMGEFFKAIDIPAFAFYDKKKRSEAETAALSSLFVVATEIPFKGSELLMVNETPPDRQWEYLVELRDSAEETNFKIPSVRPEDQRLRDLTCEVLKAQKGDGGAARLLNRCAISELPATPRAFLEDIYSRFPRPKRNPKAGSVAENDDWLSLSAKVAEESEGD
jgi:putative ATP-dependent endonuclease of OLD family